MTINSKTAAAPRRSRKSNAGAMSDAVSTPGVTTTAPAAIVAATKPAPMSKSDTVIKLLLRAKGATPMELIAATDWQAHSVRAFLTGLRKKGRIIVREARKNGEGTYRIVVPDAAPAADPAPDAVAEETQASVGETAVVPTPGCEAGDDCSQATGGGDA